MPKFFGPKYYYYYYFEREEGSMNLFYQLVNQLKQEEKDWKEHLPSKQLRKMKI